MLKAFKVFAFIFFLVSFSILCKSLFLNFYPDFSQYYFGAKAINPYLNGVIYPPLALMIFSPLRLMPFIMAEKVWTILSLISLFASVYLIFRMYKQKLFSTFGFLILGLVCLSFPVKFTLGMGQINNYILLIFVSAIYFLQQKRSYLASFLLSLSFSIKLFPAYLLLQFVAIRRWKFLLTFILSLILLLSTAFILIGPRINLYFYQHFLPTLLIGWKTDYYNQAITGFIGRSFPPNLFSQLLVDLLSASIILISCLVVFKARKNTELVNMGFGLLIILNLIVNNFSWQHHFVFLIFPFLATLFYIHKLKNNWKLLFTLFISYALVSLNLANPHEVPVLLQSHVLYGAIMLWVIEVYLIWKDSLPLGRDFPARVRR
jgi:alpha-1,2-mannosyltransferase